MTVTRYKSLHYTPDGQEIGRLHRPMEYAYIEKLDRRNPLYSIYKHRIVTGGDKANWAFRVYMDKTFGHPLRYHTAKSLHKEGKLSGDVYVIDWIDDTYYPKSHFYFSDKHAPLIFLRYQGEQA